MGTLKEKALQVYIYAFSMVATEATHYGADDKAGFEHFRTFPDAEEDRVVKLNMDTLYSFAFTQLKNTPYAVHIPRIEDRYYLFPILDAYTNIVESIGTRTPDKADGDYILLYQDDPVPEGYENYRPIRLENSLNAILLRIETRGKKDYAHINAYQDQFEIRPVFPEKVVPVPKLSQSPVSFLEKITTEDYFTLADRLSVANPIRDAEIASAAKELGIGDGTFDYNAAPEEVREALEYARESGLNKIRNESPDMGKPVISNGWISWLSCLGDYGTNYSARAYIAYHGWGANIPQDSAYASIDDLPNGEPLDSHKKYRVRFEKDGFPHAEYFWSMTLYGSESQYPARNKIDRFAVNNYDVEDGRVERNEDGSLDIIISAEEPSDPKEKKNWLPAPADEAGFELVIRIYWPDEFTLQGKWTAPVITEI